MLKRTLALWVTAAELQIKLLAEPRLAPAAVTVKDTSGNCGSFFHVEVVSPAFAGLSLVQQHRLVNEAIRAEIKVIHGLTIVTRPR